MKITLGKKIHDLRKQQNKTQDDLACALGVTGQAVSRWERDGSYPDLELLPAIAHYFGVTIDELFGYESDRTQKVDAYFQRIEAMNRENNGADVSMDACVRFARECLAEFPEEKRLTLALASVLYNAGYVRHGEHHLTDPQGYDIFDTARHREYPEWQEAMGLYERVLPRLDQGPLRDRALRELLQLYVNTGQNQKADGLIAACSEMASCREFLRLNGCDGPERAKRYGETMLAVAGHLANLIISAVMVNKARLTPAACVSLIRNALAVYRAVCPDENYGPCHGAMAHIHLYLSEHLWRAGDRDGAFAALDAALGHARRYDALKDQEKPAYTAPLLHPVPIEKKKLAPAPIAPELPQDWPWWCVPDYAQVKEEMQGDPRWQSWVSRCHES